MSVPVPLISQLRVEPPNWWVGFENQELQLLIQGDDIGNAKVNLNYPGICLEKVVRADSPNYLFLYLVLDEDAKPGNLDIGFTRPNGEEFRISYEVKKREKPGKDYLGFDTTDAIYLITPDRFANGDPRRDIVSGMKEKVLDRKDDYARHGGDIRGIIDHLDYIEEMGFTALWSSPLLTNDMPSWSYHGYAITDFYAVDPRFGDLKTYWELSEACSTRGIKLIMDQVVNHCGKYHWWMAELPFRDWINDQQAFLNGEDVALCNHRRTINQDPYAAEVDARLMTKGWFVSDMPDLNQQNEHLGTYLIQNSIWWVETLNLGGIRQDTYPYPEKDFMARWARRIMEEYPNFSIVGEEWSYNPLLVGYWQDGAKNKDGYRSYLKSTMDFPLQQDLIDALNGKETWESGFSVLYESLANDFYYPRPDDLLFFGDNHDMDRLFTQLKEDPRLIRMALAYILTVPRIPQLYYGTEIGMDNSAKPGDHGLIRSDFPGGWPKDSVNAFTGKGLKPWQKSLQEYTRKLLQFRKTHPDIYKGETLHFAPENGIYILGRKATREGILLILNKNKKKTPLDLTRFEEMGLSDKTVLDLIDNQSISWKNQLLLQKEVYLLYWRE